MVQPVGSDIHEVYVLALAELLVAVLAIIDVGWWQAGFLQNLVAVLGTILLVVAEGHDLRALYISPALHGSWAAHAKTHESHAHHVHLRCCEVECVFLPGLALGHVGHGLPFLYVVRPIKLCEAH